MPCFMFKQLQDMDEKRISRLKSFLKSFADQEKRVLPIINTCIEEMFKAVDFISPKEVSTFLITNVSFLLLYISEKSV